VGKFTNPDEKILSGSHRDTLREKSYMLVGMENMICYADQSLPFPKANTDSLNEAVIEYGKYPQNAAILRR